MPTFDLSIQGKRYHVEIPDPAASPLTVIVDGEPFAVEVEGAKLSAPRAAVRVGVEPVSAARPAPPPVTAPGTLPPPPRVAVAVPAQPTAGGANGGGDVTAPMPGTILAVDVAVGDAVEPGQQLVVLEAMKMKNPIRAPQGGTVTKVSVSVGQTVAFGELLISLA